MHPARAVRLAIAGGVAATVTLFVGSQVLPASFSNIAALPWLFFLGGPTALALLHPHLARHKQRLLRVLAALLPGAAIGLAAVDLAVSRAHPPQVLLTLTLLLANTALAVAAWRRTGESERPLFVAALALFGAAFALRLAVAVFAFFALQGAALLALAGHERDTRAWFVALGAGAAVLALGLIAILVAFGSLMPPRLALDARQTALTVTPLLALAGAVFAALLTRPARAGADAPA